MNAKTRAITSLHRDNFLAKVPGLYPDAASVNAYLLYCRPLCKMRLGQLTSHKKQLSLHYESLQ